LQLQSQDPEEPKSKRKKPTTNPDFAELREHFEAKRHELVGDDYVWSGAKDSEGIHAVLRLGKGEVVRAKAYLDAAAKVAANDSWLRERFTPAILGSPDTYNRVKAADLQARQRTASGGMPSGPSAPSAAEERKRKEREAYDRQVQAEAEAREARRKAGEQPVLPDPQALIANGAAARSTT
jgi:hypothetical protein